MIFNADGSINVKRSLALIKQRLRNVALQPFDMRLLDSILTEVVQFSIAPEAISSAISFLEENILCKTDLMESRIGLSQVGERSLEWEFFQHRKNMLQNDPAAYASKHLEVSNLVALDIFRALSPLSQESRENMYHIFMRHKSIHSARRKMHLKGLRSWEIGDYLGFAICPPSFREMTKLVACIDHVFSDNILYKQNGFVDRLVYQRDLPGFRGRRIFYIIRFNDIVCFEVQIVTLRQFVFLHLDHARYIGRPHTFNELASLEKFGDNAYLLDLIDLAEEFNNHVLLDVAHRFNLKIRQGQREFNAN